MKTTALGFTNKYYTLWNVNTTTQDLGHGLIRTTNLYTYLQNVSFDLETARRKFPEAELVEDLRGKTRRWKTYSDVWESVDVFRFGKYKFQNIAENTDSSYIAWYWTVINGEHKEFVTKVLESRGYWVREKYWEKENGEIERQEYLVSSEQLEEERKAELALREKSKEVENATALEFVPTRNVNGVGEYWDGNVIYKFAGVKENWYQGFPYYLPLLNGKQKRIKNKTIKITQFEPEQADDKMIIHIQNFEIVK